MFAMDASALEGSSAQFLEVRVAEMEAFVQDLMLQMKHVQQELSDKVSISQLDLTQQSLQLQLNQKALLSEQMDDKLLSLRYEQLDAKLNTLIQEVPVKAEVGRIDQQLKSLQQVLNLEHFEEVTKSIAQLERIQKTTIAELDNVQTTVHQELGRKTADVMCCLEDGLQGLRREMIHAHTGYGLLEHGKHFDHRHLYEPTQVSVAAQAVEQEIKAAEPPPSSFAQLDLSLNLLQQDLSQKECRRI